MSAVDASAKARLLRRAAATAPLWIVAEGSSMGGTIPTGASVLVAPCAAPRRGQVWAYCEHSGLVVVHRYRRGTEAGHVFQGDGRAHPDAAIPNELLIGRVTAMRREGRVRSMGWRDRCLGECRFVARGVVARGSRVARRRRRTR